MAVDPTNNSLPNQNTIIDYGILRTSLAQSKTQKTNNALYQTINKLITGTQSFQNFITQNFGTINTAFGSFAAAFAAINASLNALAADIASIQDEIDNYITPALIQLALQVIYIIEVDTSGGPTTINLGSVVLGFTIIKDATGNAAANPITLTGTVEGVVDPVINTNFGFYHVYFSTVYTAFLQW